MLVPTDAAWAREVPTSAMALAHQRMIAVGAARYRIETFRRFHAISLRRMASTVHPIAAPATAPG